VPLWKASYRIALPAAGEDKGLVQGFAHIENLSGQDWRAVELTLVSGNPVTFHQALYEAYFVARPEIPVEVAGRVLPRLDEGAVALAKEREERSTLGAVEMDAAKTLADVAYAAEAVAPPMAAPVAQEFFRSDDQIAGSEAVTQVVFTVADPVHGPHHPLVAPARTRRGLSAFDAPAPSRGLGQARQRRQGGPAAGRGHAL
jgi:hypothetical protein